MMPSAGYEVRGTSCEQKPFLAARRSHVAAHRGVTLAELMVVMGVFGILSIALFTLFLSALQSWDTGTSKSLSDTAASLALQQAAETIKGGMSATVNADGSLTVQLPLANSQGDYIRTSTGDQVKLYPSNGTLYQQVNTGTPVALSTGIGAATFTVSGGLVTVTITGQAQTGDHPMQTQFSQVVALRNVNTN